MVWINPENGLTVNPQVATAYSYLDRIRPTYRTFNQNIREEVGLANMGCGPSAYTLAILIQQITEGLIIDANMSDEVDTSDGIHFVMGATVIGGYLYDHGWLEIINQFDALIVSPTATPESYETSFELVLTSLEAITGVYYSLGISRLNKRIRKNLGYSKTKWQEIQGIMDAVNTGITPEEYAPWFRRLSLIQYTDGWEKP